MNLFLVKKIFHVFVICMGVFFILGSEDTTPPDIIDLNNSTLSRHISLKYSLLDDNSGIDLGTDNHLIKVSIVFREGRFTSTKNYLGGTLFLNIESEFWTESNDPLKVEIEVADKSGNKVKKVFNYTVDNIPPRLTMLGDNPLTVIKGTSYLEPGVLATDNVDGNIEVTANSTVDTSKVGDYSITYTAMDHQGNTAGWPNIRKVYVIAAGDTTPPIIEAKNNANIGADDALRYIFLDQDSGIASFEVKKINGVEPHPYDVNFYDGMLYVKKYYADFGGKPWRLGAVTIDIEVIDKSGNRTEKVFNYTVFPKNPLNTIDVELSSDLTLTSSTFKDNAYRIPALPISPNFSFSAISNSPVVKYQWAFLVGLEKWLFRDIESFGHNIEFNISKAIEAGNIIETGAYTDSYTYDALPSHPFLRHPYLVLLKVTDTNGHYGFSEAQLISVTPRIYVSDAPTKVKQGAVYIYPSGFPSLYARDYKGDTIYTIDRTGSVDTSIAGEYTLTYTAEDSEGNKASKERVIQVIPTSSSPCQATELTEKAYRQKYGNFSVVPRPWSWIASLDKPLSTTDIEAVFNGARKYDHTIEGKGDLKLPQQAIWDTFTASQKALYLINSERCARGIRPFEGADPAVIKTAQYYADYLADKDLFSHYADGNTPKERLEQYANIEKDKNADWIYHKNYESISKTGIASVAAEYPDFHEPVAKAVYNWIYTGGKLNFNRNLILQTGFDDNSHYASEEGLLGIGVATRKFEQTDGIEHHFWTKVYTVFNIFDPNKEWDFSHIETVDRLAP